MEYVGDLPANSEEAIENEKEYSLGDTSLRVDIVGIQSDVVIGDSKGRHGQRHANRAEEHQRTTSDLFDNEDRNERSHEVFRTVAGS
jgi:hypothetical protein